MKSVTGQFETRAQVEDAVTALKDAGVYSEHITVSEEDGGFSVTVNVEESLVDPAAAILDQSGIIEVDQQQSGIDPSEAGRDPSDPRSYRRDDEPDAPLIVPPLPR
jgi:hypothetical protein